MQLSIFVIISFLFKLILCDTWHSPTEFWDLEFDGSAFINEVNQWSCPLLINPSKKYSQCISGFYIMGGYGIMGGSGSTYQGNYWSKTYYNLPDHNQVNVTYNVYAVDSWDGTTSDDHYEVAVDGVRVQGWHFSAFAGYAYQYCGTSSFVDFPVVRAYMTWPHSAKTMTLQFINYLDQSSTDESLGIRDIQLNFVTMSSPQTSVCGRSNGTPLPGNACPCSTPNQYMNPPTSGTCFLCNTICATCTGPSTSECTSCYPGNYLSGTQCPVCSTNCVTCTGTSTYCTSCTSNKFLSTSNQCIACSSNCKTCTGTGNHAYWNQYCSTSCDFPLVPLQSTTTDNYLECTYPCLNTQYLYWNGSCFDSCPPPLTPSTFQGKKFCNHNCPSSAPYLYWNGSCLDSCAFPLSPELQGTYLQKYFCWYACQPTQYLYWNGSCLDNCPPPLSIEFQGSSIKRGFCWYTCQPSEYLYWNYSCMSDCPSPLSKETQGTVFPRQFCWYTCQPEQFLYWNQSCGNTCPYPLTVEPQGSPIRSFCWYSCQPSEYLYWNGSCIGSCPAPLSSETQGTYLQRKFCWYSCPTYQYLYWNDSCLTTCDFPLSPEIQGSALQTRRFCWYPCQPSEYLYWNGSCIASCPLPLSTRVDASRNFCDYPCQPDEYLYWNGSCKSACNFPLWPETEGTYLQRKFCWYPCQTNQYLYWNGSCINTCPSPLSTRIESSYRYCDYQCQPSEYLYWDKTCQANCGAYLWPETQGTYLQRQFCWYPCLTTEFLYWNGSCLSTCPLPFVQRNTHSRQYCDTSCTSDEFLYWNRSCNTVCPFPLVELYEGTLKRCQYPCMTWQYVYWDGTCQASCNSPLALDVQGTSTQRNFCWFPCAEGEFLYWNQTCSSLCPDPLIKRMKNGQYFCDFPCSTTTDYSYWNGSCSPSCLPPLLPRSEGSPTRKFCDFPCLEDEYLYWDSSCESTCNFPLVPAPSGTPIRHFCWYLCPIGEYLYWNGTCSSQCDAPLSKRTEKSRKFCDFPCDVNEYLYWNGSCLPSCDYPLSTRTEGDFIKKQFCDFPCDFSQFLYWNQTCSGSCNSPLFTRTEGTFPTLNFCDYPCDSDEYLYWNKSCLSTCDLPLVPRMEPQGKKYCDFLCPNNQFIYWDGSCSSSCSSPLVPTSDSGSPSRLFCVYPCPINQFLYWNGTCSDQCNTPLTSLAQKSRLFCQYTCSASEYLYYNGSCLPSCDLPFSSRLESDLQYCDFPCGVPSQYLYWNGSCSNSCPFPFITNTLNNHLFCDFPCEVSSQYLYWNGTCSSTCPSPFTQALSGPILPRNLCVSHCSATQYLYWNSTCSSSCDFPLIASSNFNVNFCSYPCDSSSYLYWNGSCLSSCPLPYSSRTDPSNNKYCDYLCQQASEYLYWNGSCLASCDLPLQSRTENNLQYCDFPCENSAHYLYQNSTCSSSCSFPFKSAAQGSRNFCKNPCITPDYLFWNGSCLPICASPLISDPVSNTCNPPCGASSQGKYYYPEMKYCSNKCPQPAFIDKDSGYLQCRPLDSSLQSSSSLFEMFFYAPIQPGALTIVSLVKNMQYVKYLDINMPSRLQRLSVSQGRSLISLNSGLQMSESMQEDFLPQEISIIYLKNGLHSSFLVNFWKDLVTLFIIFGLACLFTIFEKISGALQWTHLEVICQVLRVITRWNYLLMVLAINIDDIILFSAIEFQYNDFSGLSFALAIIFILAIISFATLTLIHLKKLRNSTNFTNLSRLNICPEDFQVLFRGLKPHKISTQLFFIIYMLRIGLPMLITVCIRSVPILNTVLQVFISIGILAFLIKKRPFVKRINHYQLALFESITLLMNFCVFLLSTVSPHHLQSHNFAVFLGDVVILGNDIINLLCIVFFIIKLHTESLLVHKFIKKHAVKGPDALGLWLQLLFIPLQLAHMGFEEMLAADISMFPSYSVFSFNKRKIRHDPFNTSGNKKTIMTTNMNNTTSGNLLIISEEKGENLTSSLAGSPSHNYLGRLRSGASSPGKRGFGQWNWTEKNDDLDYLFGENVVWGKLPSRPAKFISLLSMKDSQNLKATLHTLENLPLNTTESIHFNASTIEVVRDTESPLHSLTLSPGISSPTKPQKLTFEGLVIENVRNSPQIQDEEPLFQEEISPNVSPIESPLPLKKEESIKPNTQLKKMLSKSKPKPKQKEKPKTLTDLYNNLLKFTSSLTQELPADKPLEKEVGTIAEFDNEFHLEKSDQNTARFEVNSSAIQANRSDYWADYQKNVEAAIEEEKQEKLKTMNAMKKAQKKAGKRQEWSDLTAKPDIKMKKDKNLQVLKRGKEHFNLDK